MEDALFAGSLRQKLALKESENIVTVVKKRIRSVLQIPVSVAVTMDRHHRKSVSGQGTAQSPFSIKHPQR